MNRKLLNGLIVAAVAFGGVGTFTSCKDEDYAGDLKLGQTELEAQIAAIRNVTDDAFKANLEAWLNGLTNTYSQNHFATYADAVAALTKLNDVYEAIMAGDWDGSKDYVNALYDLMFNNIINGEDWYNFLFDDLAQRVTGLKIDQTYNPVFGSINLPIGLKTTVLAAYYVDGLPRPTVSFPYESDVNLAGASPIKDNDPVWTTIQNVLKPEEKVITDGMFTDGMGEGDMGGIYATVNPSTVDLMDSKYSVSIVDVHGDPVLSSADLAVEVNEDDLYLGYTRGENNVYKIMANPTTLDNEKLVTVDLSEAAKSDFLSSVKEAIKDKSISNIVGLGDELYRTLETEFVPYSLRITWPEEEIDPSTGDSKGTRDVYYDSELELAVAAVHPLSYASLDTYMENGKLDWLTSKSIPTFSPISYYLTEISNKLKIKVEATDVQYYEIMLNDEDPTTAYFVIYGENEEVLFDGKELGQTFDYSNDYAKVDDALMAAVNAVNKLNQDAIITGVQDGLNASLEPLNDLLDRVQNSNKLHYADKLVEIYNKVANKFNKVLADPAAYLQVAALYKDTQGGFHRLSSNPIMPSQANTADGAGDAIDLIISSYTGDVVVPSLYKYVAITAVNGDTTPSVLKEANDIAGLNTVLPGHAMRVAVNVNNAAFKQKKLQITYVSVDYHGVSSAQNYYVYVY